MGVRSKMIQKLEKRKNLLHFVFWESSNISGLGVYLKTYNGDNSKAGVLIKKLKRNKFGFAFLIFHYWFILRKLTKGIFMVLNFETLCHDIAGFNNLPPHIIDSYFRLPKDETVTLDTFRDLGVPLSIGFKNLKK